MRLLVLGGTAFLGHAVARLALVDGHEVTCAARGVSGRAPEGTEFVPVDRDLPDGLSSLAGREFDALVDVASRPSQVRRAVEALADRVAHATYVSTGSVYADQATPGQRSEEHTSELQSRGHLVCRLLLEKKKKVTTVLVTQTTTNKTAATV